MNFLKNKERHNRKKNPGHSQGAWKQPNKFENLQYIRLGKYFRYFINLIVSAFTIADINTRRGY